jgi:hypothetical protein
MALYLFWLLFDVIIIIIIIIFVVVVVVVVFIIIVFIVVVFGCVPQQVLRPSVCPSVRRFRSDQQSAVSSESQQTLQRGVVRGGFFGGFRWIPVDSDGFWWIDFLMITSQQHWIIPSR